jgi:hypothetical protein
VPTQSSVEIITKKPTKVMITRGTSRMNISGTSIELYFVLNNNRLKGYKINFITDQMILNKE